MREIFDKEIRSFLLELGTFMRCAGGEDTSTRGFTGSDTGGRVFNDEG